MGILRSIQERWAVFWIATQVELQGHYSIEQLQRFEQYRQNTSWLRATVVCVVMPLPCIVIITLVDLLPLEPISNGTLGSPHVWIRQFINILQISLCIIEQVRQHVPQLELQFSLLLFISVCATISAVGTTFLLSNFVGYPVPFTVVVGTFPWFFVISVLIIAFKHSLLRNKPGLTSSVMRYLLVLFCQVAMTVIYPLYNVVYKRLSSTKQTAFVFLLPVIKIFTKNWISRAIPDKDDAKPEAVVFNVEIFHALFVSLCMGSTASSRTIAALMAVDVLQAWLSFQDVQGILHELKPIGLKLNRARLRSSRDGSVPTPRTRDALQNLVTISSCIIEYEASQPKRTSVPAPDRIDALFSRDAIVPEIAAKAVPLAAKPQEFKVGGYSLVHPMPITVKGPRQASLRSDVATLSAVERGLLVKQTLKLLYITEFIVLIEYTEVIMPVIYDILVVAMYHLPNRQYYTFLEGIHTFEALRGIVGNVLFYASVEFLSLVVMGAIIWWRVRLSFIHQLAFVLEHRWLNIQTKLLVWVLDVMQTSIVQLGSDYTFQFRWLRKHGGHP